ncbi:MULTISPECIES: ArsR/SmtB family transcription factor [Paracoccus]|jgi:DNA-binding transcriptional ArsR family regulator|uniref:Regulatory protein, ArsR n=1 Tax=Paracoccus denitrificans (strain Pd 1222) TaxID=318586 RepID=A1BAN8_PARDP|nr:MULTISPECIES: metalloregulator ArsR/SmtB family transcription factor [Paracoccus]ABL72582.1 regulatory protein, ArsR [Paracoccus denitrificans PD1222]MBB4628680.1 DNA-binding transcriptional ArsR family regulator [Paracoccus denitrificans]MCU7429736.1 helix-turn-helix domain-containing protein [Paracoccus denitrificans]MDK8871321.1 metalloregulator ArsR/SmtB family transcription factor [Paracoccus sp. SSJ]QAR29572.1 transcriptional regulator [Paracoccus denitrificans]
MSTEDQDDALFKALGHRARRQLLDLLKNGPKTTGGLCEALPQLDRCTVMQHLRVLETAGLVVVERRGRERWNHLDALPIHALHERWIGPYAAYAAQMLNGLRQEVEGRQPQNRDESLPG